MSETKTPYELRLEMIQMAKDYLDRQYETAVSTTMDMWKANVEFGNKFGKAISNPELPKMYTMEDIFAMADKFNSFVSGKK